MTNEKIVQALEAFGLQVFTRDFADSEVKSYNYFVYYESKIRRVNSKYYQDVEVVYVSENQSNPNYFEIDVIEALEKTGLKLKGDGEYGSFQKPNTNEFVDTLALVFERPIKKAITNETSI
jgi:hypothetical protein